MPIYTYKDKKTDVHVEVIRDFKDWDRLPEGKEIPESLAGTEPDWERVIGNVSVVKGHGWGAGKGSWIQLLTGGMLLCTLLQNFLS